MNQADSSFPLAPSLCPRGGRKEEEGRLASRCVPLFLRLAARPNRPRPLPLSSYLKKILACPPLSAPPPPPLLSRDIFTRPFLRGRNLLQDMRERPISPRAALSAELPTDRSCKGDVWCVRLALRRLVLLSFEGRPESVNHARPTRRRLFLFCPCFRSGWFPSSACRIREGGEGGGRKNIDRHKRLTSFES